MTKTTIKRPLSAVLCQEALFATHGEEPVEQPDTGMALRKHHPSHGGRVGRNGIDERWMKRHDGILMIALSAHHRESQTTPGGQGSFFQLRQQCTRIQAGVKAIRSFGPRMLPLDARS